MEKLIDALSNSANALTNVEYKQEGIGKIIFL
jgi:hypothetical protein